MANEIQGIIWRVEFPTLAMKTVALKLADHADSDGRNVFPSVASVAQETGCSESTVRDAIALLEGVGLLTVATEGHGNARYRSTVNRSWDLDRLALIAFTRRQGQRVPAAHALVLRERDPEPGELRDDGKPRKGKVRWLEIVASTSPDTPPESGGVNPPNPSGERRGTPPESGATPPESGGYPSGVRTQTFKEPSLTTHSDARAARHEDRGGGRFADLIDEICENRFLARALNRIDETIEIRPKGSARALLTEIAQRCGRESDRVLWDAAGNIVETRAILAVPKDFLEAVALARQTSRVSGRVEKQLAPPSEPEVAERWADFREVLNRELGEDVVSAWFAPAGLDRLRKGVLTIAVHAPFTASYTMQNFATALRVAARETFTDQRIVDVQVQALPAVPGKNAGYAA